jgi:hypothetical protein
MPLCYDGILLYRHFLVCKDSNEDEGDDDWSGDVGRKGVRLIQRKVAAQEFTEYMLAESQKLNPFILLSPLYRNS